MIHTMRIIARLLPYEFTFLKANLPSLTDVSDCVSRTNFYSRKGLTQIELIQYVYRWKGTECASFYIAIRINVSAVMGENKIFLLESGKYRSESIMKGIYKRISEIMEFRHIKLDKAAFSVSRADFAIDVQSSVPETLIYLCNLAFPHKYCRLERVEISGKPFDKLFYESCYFKNKSKKVNIYIKGNELVNNGKEATDKDLSRALKTVRFEIQHETMSIYRLAKQTATGRQIQPFLEEEYSANYLVTEIEKMFGTEKFVSESKACELIDNSDYSTYEKGVLMSIIRAVHIYKGIYNLEKAIEDESTFTPKQYGSRRKFKAYLKMIRRLGISPATIPDRFGVDELSSIAEIIKGGTPDEHI